MDWYLERSLSLFALLMPACAMDNPAYGRDSVVAEGTAGDSESGASEEEGEAEGSSSGDGDGDPVSGDGDPDPGDGDGDPVSGDGDGDPIPGDGDGDPMETGAADTGFPGDGDGDFPGDGDGDDLGDLCADLDEGSCIEQGGCGPVMFEELGPNPEEPGTCSYGWHFDSCIAIVDCEQPMFPFWCDFDSEILIQVMDCIPTIVEEFGLDVCGPPPEPFSECV